jgi:hypothetical protein
MTLFKTKFGLCYMVLALLCVSNACIAQPQPGKLQLDNLDKLNAKASVVNDVTLDGALLGMATKAVASSDDPDAKDVKEAIKGLKGIYIKNFEFDKPHQYTPEDVEAIRSQLAHGWTRIVQSQDKRQEEINEIYLLKNGDKVEGVAILVAEPKELTVVNIVGPIDFEKLGALGGKLGIPDGIKTETQKPKSKTPAPSKPNQKDDSHDNDDDEDFNQP